MSELVKIGRFAVESKKEWTGTTYPTVRYHGGRISRDPLHPMVHFYGGSYAIPDKLSVWVNGLESIRISGPTEGPVQVGQKPYFFVGEWLKSRHLRLENLTANVVVTAHKTSITEVRVFGPEHLVQNVEILEQDGVVVIRQKQTPAASVAGNNSVVINGRVISDNVVIGDSYGSGVTVIGGHITAGSMIIGGNVVHHGDVNISVNSNSLSGGDFHVSHEGHQEQLEIHVQVPYQEVQITSTGVNGLLTIGDMIKGEVNLTGSGSQVVQTGKISNLTANLTGSAQMKVDSVDGDVALHLGGSAHAQINGGKINALNAALSGTSHASINTIVQSAVLNVGGIGHISITRVTEKPVQLVSGMAHVQIGNW